MLLTMMKSKLHRATVTQADLHYEGSISIDRDLLDAAEIYPHEQVDVLNISTGARFTTYAIEAPRGSRVFGVEDFRESYSPAQWSEVRQRLAEAKFRSARVFLQVELSDQMKQYLGASTARAEVPSVILE